MVLPGSWIRQSQSKQTHLEKGRGRVLLKRVGLQRLTCFRSGHSWALHGPPGTSGSTGARPSQASPGYSPCKCWPIPPSPGSRSPSLLKSPELALKKHLVNRALRGPGKGGSWQKASGRSWEEVLAAGKQSHIISWP